MQTNDSPQDTPEGLQYDVEIVMYGTKLCLLEFDLGGRPVPYI